MPAMHSHVEQEAPNQNRSDVVGVETDFLNLKADPIVHGRQEEHVGRWCWRCLTFDRNPARLGAWGLYMGPVQYVVVGRLGESVGRVRERAGARGGLNMTVLDDMYS
jgi:hypothetical protein